MVNSSDLKTSDGLQTAFPRNAFHVLWTVLVALGVVVAVFIPVIAGTIAWVIQHGVPSRAVLQTPQFQLYAVYMQGVGETLAAIYLLALMPVLAKVPLRRIGFRSPQAADAGAIVLGIVAMFLVVGIIATFISKSLHFSTPETAIDVYKHLTGGSRAGFVFFGAIVAPVFEETMFRIFLFNAFRKWFGLGWGIAISSFLFGLAHVQPPWNDPRMYLSICFPLMIGGAILAYVYYRTGKAWASMVVHAGFNLISFALLTFYPNLAK